MNLTAQIAKLFRDLYYGGNWTGVDVKESLAGVNWQHATTKVKSLNTIAALVFHMNYYVTAVLEVLQGKALYGSDKNSFDAPPIGSQQDWEELLNKTWAEVEKFATQVEQLPENKLWETFSDEKYGNYYKNIHGVIEHCYYHLGQIVLIKKILLENDKN